ncbi:MAG: multidrug effflux MFS transporter [Hydrogenophaga sp.]|uniref:multidrug effflux MFS transporter n=1 Tax=Hydrogenophaga sp. TaxID=1904254 RepID=UPI0025BBE66A|nr:multidrug effflux MFS transporter [Hydrogenophaga sp.]MBU7574484.1 multidrug effflux MFS transporter [Hydrogenophaga sp.]
MQTTASPRLSVLIALSALAILPLNMFVPSLPNIARDLGADFALVNLAVAGYAIATAVAHLVAGAMSDRFGRKPVALAALAIYTLASIGCSLATDIATFLVCRMFQATVIAGYAVSLAAIRDTSDEGGAASRIGYVSSAWAVAPMIGPTVGGLLDSAFGWRANFVAFAVLGLAGLWLVAFHLKETNHHRTASFALQLKGYGELGRSPPFWAYALCMAFGIGTLYAFLGGAPLVAAQLGGLSSTALGAYMGMVPAGFMLGSYIVGHTSSRHAPTRLILIGRLLTAVGLLVGLVLLASGLTHPLAFFGPCVFVGLGNGLTMPAANARILSLRPHLAGTASGLAAAVTVIGAGIVAFLAGLVVNASNAHVAVLAVMWASSLLSLLVALFIVHTERERKV